MQVILIQVPKYIRTNTCSISVSYKIQYVYMGSEFMRKVLLGSIISHCNLQEWMWVERDVSQFAIYGGWVTARVRDRVRSSFMVGLICLDMWLGWMSNPIFLQTTTRALSSNWPVNRNLMSIHEECPICSALKY